MIDVHPPHHAASSWRDFFIHIATIVVGLLIAIGLEQTVEWFHHQHIVHVARETIRHEIETNQREIVKDLNSVQADEDAMKQNVQVARMLYAHPETRGLHMSFFFDWSSLDESAWRTARDSGALTFMPVDEVQRYADVYDQQTVLNNQAVKIFSDQVDAASPMTIAGEHETPDPADIKLVMHSAAQLQGRLYGLHQLLAQLGDQYKQVLKH